MPWKMAAMIPLARLHGFPAPAPDFSDPIGLLIHCHARIESRLDALERAGELLPRAPRAVLASLFGEVDAAVQHFAVAGVLHTQDEEVSLFPRLRRRDQAAGDDALAAVAGLEAEHRTAETVHRDLDALVGRIPRDGSAGADEIERFRELTGRLRSLYAPHIRLENTVVFPIAARVLGPEDLGAIGAEMRERRRPLLGA
ncbi:MAG TPA: hemerythrin domain-containing protein [Thermodesulfobacteriota bacterium]